MSNFVSIEYYLLYVRTQFVVTQNDIGFTRKKAQTISFVERGFERLGLVHWTVVWVSSSQ